MSKKELCPECGGVMTNMSHRIYAKNVKQIKRSKNGVDTVMSLCLRCNTGKFIEVKQLNKIDLIARQELVEKNSEVVSMHKNKDGSTICTVKIVKPKFQMW